jgi:hypothetical protein
LRDGRVEDKFFGKGGRDFPFGWQPSMRSVKRDEVDRRQTGLSKAVAIVQKPHGYSDLMNVITPLVI